MDHAINMDGRETRAMPNERLEALKGRNLLTPDNQQPFGDGDLNKVMDSDLYEATKKGDVEKFIHALEKVSESRKLALSLIFDQVTPSGNSLLHVATSSGRVDVMELILFHYPDLVIRKNSSEDTPLHVAVQDAKFNATEMLMRLGTDSEIIYWKNRDSKSPLYLAAEIGDIRILRLLLEPSARDEAYAVKIQGISPVLAALEEEKSDILEAIIDQLPKLLHVRDENGRTPLHSAALVGNAGALRLLKRKCHYLALQTDKNGSYPIHIACEGGNVDTILELVDMWPDLAEIKNKKGQNILHVAARGGNNDAVQYILKEGREPVIKKLVNSKDVDGNTPARLASMHNHSEVLRSLTMDNRSDLQLLKNDRLNALDVAMESGSLLPNHEALQGGAIPIEAGVPESIGQDLRSTSERSSGESGSSRIEWIKKEIDTRLIVATLVASVTFTAGIALPGGYNTANDPNPGMPILLHNRGFQVFIIFDMFATYGSILSVLTLLLARSANFPRAKVYFGLAGMLLSAAVIFMTVAFSASLIVAVSKLKWLKIFCLCFGVSYAWTILLFAEGLPRRVQGDTQSGN